VNKLVNYLYHYIPQKGRLAGRRFEVTINQDIPDSPATKWI